jgi:hypothetical protein
MSPLAETDKHSHTTPRTSLVRGCGRAIAQLRYLRQVQQRASSQILPNHDGLSSSPLLCCLTPFVSHHLLPFVGNFNAPQDISRLLREPFAGLLQPSTKSPSLLEPQSGVGDVQTRRGCSIPTHSLPGTFPSFLNLDLDSTLETGAKNLSSVIHRMEANRHVPGALSSTG